MNTEREKNKNLSVMKHNRVKSFYFYILKFFIFSFPLKTYIFIFIEIKEGLIKKYIVV